MSEDQNKYGVYIGGVEPETAESIGKTVIEILSAPHADEKTKRAALKTLGIGVQSPHNLTFNNMNIDQNEEHDYGDLDV